MAVVEETETPVASAGLKVWLKLTIDGRVCEWENCMQALKRVKANKGSPGDGMTVQQLPK